MSHPQGPPSTPAGWYADPAGSPQQRWWDGVQWTDHLQAPATAAPAPAPAPATPVAGYGQPAYPAYAPAYAGGPAAPAAFPPVAPGTPAYGPLIWVITLLPLVSFLLLPLALADFENSIRSAVADPYGSPYGGFSGGGLALQALSTVLSWALYGGGVVLAYFDRKWLLRQGYVQPFHWAFAFLGVVYTIGRSVVVRRRSGRGIAPMWVSIAIMALSFVVAIGLVVWVVNLTMSTVTTFGSYT
ncbi:MAG: DUF2510 domain-containing protein [Herbiconiux sp.]|nr:DUF2510 domain-containing protein [Herbiconiux sp.]